VDIWVFDADGSNGLNLTPTPSIDEQPSWSPDGERISFISDRAGTKAIYTMKADGSGVVVMTVGTADFQLAWSPFLAVAESDPISPKR